MSPWVTVISGPPSAAAVVQHIAMRAPVGDAARSFRSVRPTDQPALDRQGPAMRISATASMMPGPADAGDAGRCPSPSAKPGSSDQRSDPITAKARLLGHGVDLDPLDGARGGALAGLEICAPSNAGPVGLEQASTRRLVAKQDFGVGADIDDQHHVLGFVRLFRQRHGCGIGPDMAGDAGQDIDPGGTVHGRQVELAGIERQAAAGRQREGGLAQFHRIDAEQQVVHHRIADEDRFRRSRSGRPRPRWRSTWTSPLSAARTAAVISTSPPGFIIT